MELVAGYVGYRFWSSKDRLRSLDLSASSLQHAAIVPSQGLSISGRSYVKSPPYRRALVSGASIYRYHVVVESTSIVDTTSLSMPCPPLTPPHRRNHLIVDTSSSTSRPLPANLLIPSPLDVENPFVSIASSHSRPATLSALLAGPHAVSPG